MDIEKKEKFTVPAECMETSRILLKFFLHIFLPSKSMPLIYDQHEVSEVKCFSYSNFIVIFK